MNNLFGGLGRGLGTGGSPGDPAAAQSTFAGVGAAYEWFSTAVEQVLALPANELRAS